MNDLTGLRDVSTSAAWLETHAEALRQELAQRLGDDWAPATAETDAHPLSLVHRPTELVFCIVPGGAMQMGLLKAEAELVDWFLGDMAGELFQDIRRAAAPVRSVEVAPFLCTRELLASEQLARLAPGIVPSGAWLLSRSDALTVAAHCGFRLPSEAELEWLARNGKQEPFVLGVAQEAPEDDPDHVVLVPRQHPHSRFGVEELFYTQWAADDWFDNHEGAPTTSLARCGGDSQGVRRFEEFCYDDVGDEAVVAMLSSRRDPGRGWKAGIRLACSLPEPALS